MGVFHQEEPQNSSNKCNFLVATLKDVFSNCRACGGRLSSSSQEPDHPTSDLDEEQEVIVSEIRSRAMEKSKHKTFVMTQSFSWFYSPKTGELFISPKSRQKKDDDDNNEKNKEDDDKEEFLSVRSCFSCCSSALSKETFFSVKTNFSLCSSLKELEFSDSQRRRSIIMQLCHCEGWPFGLCRKALLLPPLPKSPSESWSWRKRTRIVNLHQVYHISH